MASDQTHLTLLFLFTLISPILSHSIIQQFTKPHLLFTLANTLYCDSWRFSVETNDAGSWSFTPEKCIDYVKDYMTGDRYISDSEVVADDSLEYAKTVELTGKDAWVFDIDETLLSNLPYYADKGFDSQIYDEESFNNWVEMSEAPSLPASLRLYNELEEMGITVFLLTGRDEYQRNVTEKNLLQAGFSNWKKLFLRGTSDKGKAASVYKSEKRMELVDEGYVIHGCSGDQWSDLSGYAVATRSFKLPNPMYYIA
ncbi:acid phosphatase 1 isoform X2 [Daucus carota subsp. sativus]|uniref:acid phosphatase 1 isoform X2 n=1 Tax=Daucus carota subsp. sativus TaxID=79200 RepID=UPI0007F00440|nr:PREDICTED: acid phosphatase 1-like isoform X2 [Daucus carota subsp. sativus]